MALNLIVAALERGPASPTDALVLIAICDSADKVSVKRGRRCGRFRKRPASPLARFVRSLPGSSRTAGLRLSGGIVPTGRKRPISIA